MRAGLEVQCDVRAANAVVERQDSWVDGSADGVVVVVVGNVGIQGRVGRTWSQPVFLVLASSHHLRGRHGHGLGEPSRD